MLAPSGLPSLTSPMLPSDEVGMRSQLHIRCVLKMKYGFEIRTNVPNLALTHESYTITNGKYIYSSGVTFLQVVDPTRKIPKWRNGENQPDHV